ncbi:DUF5698 domain-containing protein [Aggregatilinea lenta]|uniref:DUF5698 domain-containing protein n=1 Tax=Aggregatilinea lenta TaxID=913108 RepID=UPI000E5B7399|nr:DUF5698 domain-containing protein [Aggregatilinea lenta]
MDVDVLLAATGIFTLRVVGNMITTVRLVNIVRNQKLAALLLGALESLVFALALGSVVSNLDNLWNLSAYCFGYAIGGYLGMLLEQRLVHRFVSVLIISPLYGPQIAAAIRDAGYGATETMGRGARGEVETVTVVVGHREVNKVIGIAHEVDEHAFVMLDELRSISRGYFRMARPEQR